MTSERLHFWKHSHEESNKGFILFLKKKKSVSSRMENGFGYVEVVIFSHWLLGLLK